jgi:hypothetical protein
MLDAVSCTTLTIFWVGYTGWPNVGSLSSSIHPLETKTSSLLEGRVPILGVVATHWPNHPIPRRHQ